MDCGPTSLKIVAKYYGKHFSLQSLRSKSHVSIDGVSVLGISDAAESIGFKTLPARISIDELHKAIMPFIIYWKQRHFMVVYKIKGERIYVSDPAHGLSKFNKQDFLDGWAEKNTDSGIVLLLEPTVDFYNQEDEKPTRSLSFFLQYLKPYRSHILQLFIGLLIGSLIQLVIPFLTQSIVDIGINNGDYNFITLILIAQLMLFISSTSVSFIRGWILLHMGTRLNISIISDFLVKLMKLPIAYFDIKKTGDILQRIWDHKRIENFLTSSSLNAMFSLMNLIVFGTVLALYNVKIFIVFLGGSLIYVFWILIFLKRRKEIDYKRFNQLSSNQSIMIQLIHGMQEIKLLNSEKIKRWNWERIQAKLFKTGIKSLALEQHQQIGSNSINELKNILITFLAASAVINGEITLGMMLAVQYIIGQLNAPIHELVNFVHGAQDARISMERLSEIHQLEDEEDRNKSYITEFDPKVGLSISNLSYQYEGPHSRFVLRNVNFSIPFGKITAIVGTSGSGKTTLLKLLLRFYNPIEGEIKLGDHPLNNYSIREWRDKCGSVMQDGYIFSDTIEKNIAVKDEIVDKDKLSYSLKIANIEDLIKSLPLGVNTKIGSDGSGLSQGQKQRILIARSVYKNPSFIFFDEATNSLDANNERTIMNNLEMFFNGRTVIIVAHRLSTVKNADQIVVLNDGKVVEIGSHSELTKKRGHYFDLVKNQLELGN